MSENRPTIEVREGEPKIPTEFYNIKSGPEYDRLRGNHIGELLNEKELNLVSAHLTAEGKNRLIIEGRGDVAVLDISPEGWSEILNGLKMDENETMEQIKRALTELDFITWDKLGSGH